jgi:DNA-binding transcriptional regulator YhcF (GntR family)
MSSTTVTLLRFRMRPGESIFDQVVYAAKKAFISGEFQTGQPFPSVRTLAAELKIHPNTAHKVVQYLSKLKDAQAVIREYQPLEHFKRTLVIPELKLSDWGADQP